jgi:hypothetical protein
MSESQRAASSTGGLGCSSQADSPIGLFGFAGFGKEPNQGDTEYHKSSGNLQNLEFKSKELQNGDVQTRQTVKSVVSFSFLPFDLRHAGHIE